MKRYFPIVLTALVIVASVSFASWQKRIVNAYASQAVEGQRVVIEKSAAGVKVRYEKIIRDGYNEIVKVLAPEFFEWAYLNGKTYIVLGSQMKLSPATIVDAEQTFMKTLSSTTTEISTSLITYEGEKACEFAVHTLNATYEGIILLPSMIMVKLTVQKTRKELNISYSQIKLIKKGYFETVLRKYKILNTPPSILEVEIWKVVYHLEHANVTSFSVPGISGALIDGMDPKVGKVIVYVFQADQRLSATSLSVQFKYKGFTAIGVKHDGVDFLFVSSSSNKKKLERWIKNVLENTR